MTTPTLPVPAFASDADTLFRWMGLFWSTLYQDPDYLRRCQGARALGVAQAYLNLLETATLLDRNAAPVLHRERWHPLVLRLSERDSGGAATLRFGMQPAPVFGPQTGAEFTEGAKFRFGKSVEFADVYTYPLNPAPLDCVCITDNIAAPKTVLIRDRDFTIQGGSLVLRKANDPFADGSGFAVDTDGAGKEAVLWACDAMFDKDYVYNHIGYVMGVRTASTDYFKRLINAVWDLVNNGATPALLRQGLAALCNVPVCVSDGETVESAESGTVITDANVYGVTLPSVSAGDRLAVGQPLTDAIRIYGPVTASVLGTESLLRTDIPNLPLPPSHFAVPLAFGLSAGWDTVPVYYDGDDVNGNPRLWFPLQGTDADVRAFWSEVWSRCASSGTSLRTCFEDLLDDTVVANSGAVWGHVQPLDFMLRHLIGANTVFVVLDTDQLRDAGARSAAPAFVELIRRSLPVYVRLFVVEKRSAGPDAYSLEESSASDTVLLTVSLSAESAGRVGGQNPGAMTFKDRPPVKRWVAIRR